MKRFTESIAKVPYRVTHADVEKARRKWWSELTQKERDKYMKEVKIITGKKKKPVNVMRKENKRFPHQDVFAAKGQQGFGHSRGTK